MGEKKWGKIIYYSIVFYSIALVVGRLFYSNVHVCILLCERYSAPCGTGQHLYPGLCLPPVRGVGLLGLDGDKQGGLLGALGLCQPLSTFPGY